MVFHPRGMLERKLIILIKCQKLAMSMASQLLQTALHDQDVAD